MTIKYRKWLICYRSKFVDVFAQKRRFSSRSDLRNLETPTSRCHIIDSWHQGWGWMCAIFFIGFLFFSVWFFAFRKFSGCRGLRAYVFKLLILKAQHRIKKTLLPIFCQQKRHFSCYIQSNQCWLTLLNARLNNLAWCFPSILQVIQDIQIDWSSPSIPYQSQLHFCMYAWPHHRCCRKRFFPPSVRFERFVENQ